MSSTLPQMILERAAHRKDKAALRYKQEGRYRDISWQELAARIGTYAQGLQALGIKPGDRAAVMAPNGPDWVCADLGIMACRGISVPVYHTEGMEILHHVLKDSQSRFLFLHSPELAEKLKPHLEDLEYLEKVILWQGGPEDERFVSINDLLSRGETGAFAAPVEARDEETATIVYTSGTTGPPKGVMLSHANILSNVEGCAQIFPLGEDDVSLSFLPLSHVFERTAGYYFMLNQGAVIAYAESFDAVPENLLEVRPTVVTSVPRLYEKMHGRVLSQVHAGSAVRQRLFDWALRTCKALVAEQQAGRRGGLALRAAAGLARKLVFAKLIARLGGRLRFFVSGGAPLEPEIAEFFMAAGMPIYQGYGLTETSPVIAANTPVANRLGTVGKPIPGTEVRIAEDGEILVRGPGIFQGYWQQPEQTAEVFDDGWLRTGDIGRLDEDGYLLITDRKKNLIVTAGGENIAPQVLENRLKSDRLIANVMVYGDRKPYLTALIVPELSKLEEYAESGELNQDNTCDLVRHPQVLALIRERVDRIQENLPAIQQIKRFTLLSRDFSGEAGEITPTQKIKRKVVREHFSEILEGMYEATNHGRHDQGYCVPPPEEKS